jgi:beta-phosphoglucomutase-like phosphatase (HAD superfamily)
VIFDLDGVLLDTEPIYTEVTHLITSRFGKAYDWSIKANMLGRPAMDSAEYLISTLGLPIRPAEYLAEREPMLERRLAGVGEIHGAEAFTRHLHQRDIPMAIATSTDARLFQVKIAGHREWFQIFKTVVCGDDPRVVRGKPAPDIFLAAAQGLGAAPETCLVIEDSPFGVAAAIAAGMHVVGMPDPRMDRGRFADAHFVVESFEEMRTLDLVIGRG